MYDLTKRISWNIYDNSFDVLADGTLTSAGRNRDNRHGKAESSEFWIDARYIEAVLFLNAWNDETAMTVLIDGKKEFMVTDSIMVAGEVKYIFDVSEFLGKKARIVLADAGSWEMVTLKSLSMTDVTTENGRLIKPISKSVMLDITLPINDGKYINIPIEKQQNSELCNFYFDGKAGLNLFLRLAKYGKTDFIASIPIGEFDAENVRICSPNIFIPVENVDEFYKQIYISDNPSGYENFYKEAGRPKLHSTATFGGIGDMIGFYYYKGRYNIGYLHDVGYNNWNNNSSWSFSESKNLFKWDFSGIRVRKGFNTRKSSGCGFVDEKNASGLKCGKDAPIMLFYSVEKQDSQRMQDFYDDGNEVSEYLSRVSVKYSTDGGKTFREYENNPIFLTQGVGGHDPEVFYYEPEDKYVLLIHDKRNKKWGFDFYESKNLLDWEYMSTVSGMWETPNFYPLDLCGKTYWILQQCDFSYCIGDFNGCEFVSQTEMIKNFYGAYAMRTFYVDGRRILIGSRGQDFDSMDYQGYGVATLPMELSLKDTENGMKLCYHPVCEIDDLVKETKEWKDINAADFNKLGIESGLLDIEIRCKNAFSLMFGETEIFECTGGEVRIITDETVVSYFENGGMSAGFLSVPDYHADGKTKLTIKRAAFIESISIKVLKSPYEI